MNISYSSYDETHWYDLFSRGGRDWLRHKQKVSDAVREQLPGLLARAEVLGDTQNRTVRVPIRTLEHYRFRLNQRQNQQSVGQGKVQPGDVLRSGKQQQEKRTGSGEDEGGVEFIVELKVDEIVDWLWEELRLPNLQPKKSTTLKEEEWLREGWDRRGSRSRLDRRRTMKEALKRRTIQPSPPFINEDLRFRQIKRRPQPSSRAAVIFGLDASSSMEERERVLAKSFFFWALQGIRKQYQYLDTLFIAHTIEAWEFNEEEFFQVSAQGGTVASTCFSHALKAVNERFDPALYNLYFFYASDGENFSDDRETAIETLSLLAPMMNFMGYVEACPRSASAGLGETGRIFDHVINQGAIAGKYPLRTQNDIWEAIRAFFTHKAIHESPAQV